MKKKTTEELLEEQGLKQINVFDILYPERVEKQTYLVINGQKKAEVDKNAPSK